MKKFFKVGCLGLIALFVIVVLILVMDTSNDDEQTTEPKTNETVTEDNDASLSNAEEEADTLEPVEEEPVVEEPKKDDGKINSGTYKIGTDLPAGEYLVISKSMAYIESTSDSTGQLDSIIFNDNLSSGAHSYVTLNDGEYFKLQGGEMYPVDLAPSVIPEDGLYTDGMYKVGQDIPAGEYKVILDSAIGMGYLEVNTDSRHQLNSIITNENVQADMYISVSDGQYLKLQDVKIQK